jgi:hypothetical protein
MPLFAAFCLSVDLTVQFSNQFIHDLKLLSNIKT